MVFNQGTSEANVEVPKTVGPRPRPLEVILKCSTLEQFFFYSLQVYSLTDKSWDCEEVIILFTSLV